MARKTTRPAGTLLRSSVDPREEASKAGERELVRWTAHAQRFVYSLFGIESEPVVGFERFADRYAPWRRLSITLPGFDFPFNFAEDDGKGFLVVGGACPYCEQLVYRTFQTALELADLLDAPGKKCPTCEKLGVVRVVNVIELAQASA